MIDKTKEFWTGDRPEDIDEWLREYTELDDLTVKPVLCRSCGSNVFQQRVDEDEGAIQVICAACKAKKILLDGEDVWEDCRPRIVKCICKGKDFNIRIGLDHRDDGDIRWVYAGSRCVACGTLGSYVDWNIDYGPTDAVEQNI